MNRITSFKNLLKEEQITAPHEPEIERADVSIRDIITEETPEENIKSIDVVFNDVEAVRVSQITDSKGRLSDTLDAISAITGFATLPLSITTIPSEIASLQRHKLYTVCGARYAMAMTIRDDKVNNYCSAIAQNLQDGVPYSMSLFKPLTYNGQTYQSLDLTEGEWTMILSKFRNYKQRLFIKDDTDLILEVYPASSQN